ncbi:TPA: NAD(P)/FAD-dependent oxidoreductase, partial [Enterococcus faecalis]|nr:NAD(P)/FAD-dependent oxidoreductase [Enterococcus faecalis]
DNTKIQVEGERIFINTGSKAIKLPIDGLNKSKNVLDSTTAMEQVIAPEKIVIIGAGYIGLEFASMFNSYGSKVSILDASSEFLPREDEDISTLIYKD